MIFFISFLLAHHAYRWWFAVIHDTTSVSHPVNVQWSRNFSVLQRWLFKQVTAFINSKLTLSCRGNFMLRMDDNFAGQ